MGKRIRPDVAQAPVPATLRRLFVLHFVVDYLFAIPLLVAPRLSLGLLGWTDVDPLATRLVAAALLGIGGISYLARRADAATFRHMLTMKLLWSGAAIAGLLLSILEGAPRFAWVILWIFLLFFFVWLYWRIRLGAAHSRP